jgi:hypothetical protein
VTIQSVDQYIAAAKQQNLQLKKTATRTTIAAAWFSLFDIAGSPGAGTLAIGNTANGVVPTDATAGHPTIDAFGSGNIGALTKIDFGSSVACRIRLFDRVFAAGAYAFNANTNLASQPSYAGRVNLRNYATGLDANDYKGLEIWVEQVTAATGNQAVAVTYTNEAGTGSRTTGAVGIGAAPTVGRCWQLPLQAGDAGVQRIDNVTGSVASVGTFNVMVLRPLWTGRVPVAAGGDVHDFLKTGLVQVFADSALYALVQADSTSSGLLDLQMEVANG